MYQIDNQSRVPIYEQIIRQVEQFVLTGALQPLEQLPSVRAMSMEIHLNPNTVQKAYSELERRKVIFTVSGKGTFITDKAKTLLQQENRKGLGSLAPAVRQLALSGVKKQEIIDVVEQVYKEDQND